VNILPSTLIEVRVSQKTLEADGIFGFELASLDGAALPGFTAGSHVDVHLPNGLIRQYSLCNTPGEVSAYKIGVLRDANSRGGSAAMHDAVDCNTTLKISAPKNHFALDENATRSLLFAGGIGITPLFSMAQRLDALQADFELHYSTRAPQLTAFKENLRSARYAKRVHFHHDNGDVAQKLDLAAVLSEPAAGTNVYVCGPSGYLDFVRATARGFGWSDAQIHFEYFAGQAQQTAQDQSFDVELRRSGRVIRIQATQTITQALLLQGIHVPVSCEQGVCGTCLTTVLEGEVDHKDLYLSPQEQAANTQFLPCCSRAKSGRLVIDL
jgi:vanillate monooxygenase ferredoxin subunit